jgi:hypothetical protein
VGRAGERLRREGGTGVAGVTGLSAAGAWAFVGVGEWFGRLDDVGGGWLGRGGRVLAGRSELLAELLDKGTQVRNLLLQIEDLSLQLLAARTRANSCLHDFLSYNLI